MTIISAQLNEERAIVTSVPAYLPWLVCFTGALFFFYEFIQLNMFNAISTDLMRDFSLNSTQLGYLSATYLLGDVVFLFPAGILLDRLSVRWVMITAMIICILGTITFALSHSIAIASMAHFAAGIGNAFCFLSCIMLASRWFPPSRMALVVGLIVTIAMAGGWVAQTPLTLLATAYGWREALVMNAGLGIMILTLIMLFVRDYPPMQQEVLQQRQDERSELGFWPSISKSLGTLQNWLGGIYTCLMNLPIMIIGAIWGNLHLVQDHHLSPAKASMVTGMIFLGTIIGSPIVGWLSDQLSVRRLPMLVCAILALINILAIMLLPNLSFTDLVALYLMLGLITSGQILSYPTIAESNPKFLTGTSMGLAAVIIMGGAGISQPLFGWMLNRGTDKLIVNGAPVFSHTDFLLALTMIPIAFIVAMTAAFFIRETYCKSLTDLPITNRES